MRTDRTINRGKLSFIGEVSLSDRALLHLYFVPRQVEMARASARYLLQFSDASGEESKALGKYVIQRLESQGLHCENVEREAETCVIVSANADLLAKQARG